MPEPPLPDPPPEPEPLPEPLPGPLPEPDPLLFAGEFDPEVPEPEQPAKTRAKTSKPATEKR